MLTGKQPLSLLGGVWNLGIPCLPSGLPGPQFPWPLCSQGTKTLCGSIAPMDVCVRHFLQATGCSVEAALEAASLHPAQLLGLEKSKGSLDFGADADFVVLDDNLRVQATYISGELVWQAEEARL
ncbi:Hypothetical predicted protein [Marmota monax]|uniref:Amidohydrolase-related domain-containing protein n=1 Tax=Marmota monax TaxID=9995 RepID=A0A5E4BZX4_MARMO|nr:hypothetical protein GHT09_017569 [Marmota monax]VTJ75208.1 Hypothetical predicted protein [Marmota monax]